MTVTSLIGRVVVFVALLSLYVVQFRFHPAGLDRPFLLFIIGDVLAVFIRGPIYGRLQPISTRPIMIILGVLLMAAPVVWLLTASASLSQ